MFIVFYMTCFMYVITLTLHYLYCNGSSQTKQVGQCDFSGSNEFNVNRKQSTQSSAIGSLVDSTSSWYVPYVGQFFCMYEETRWTYIDYAGRVGFSACKGLFKLVNGVIVFVGFYVAKKDSLILKGKPLCYRSKRFVLPPWFIVDVRLRLGLVQFNQSSNRR